jgi:hypothetical protein
VLNLVDESLEALLRAAVPLSSTDIDVSFDVPNDDWSAKLTRPTVNLHLWDVRRSVTRSITGVETVDRADGTQIRRMALPRVELRYFVTVWSSDARDERTLIGALLVALLAHGEIPTDFVPAALQSVPPPQLAIARADEGDLPDSRRILRLGLHLTATVAVDTGLGSPLAPAVSEIGLGVRDRSTGATDTPLRRIAGECTIPEAVGVTVRSPRGSTTVNPTGRFLIAARPGDEIVVELDPPRTVVAPASGGVVVSD